MTPDLLTIMEAVEIEAHRTSYDAIYTAVRRGYLPAVKRGRDWYVTHADLKDYLDGRHERWQTAHTDDSRTGVAHSSAAAHI